jgi:hypothetical protein
VVGRERRCIPAIRYTRALLASGHDPGGVPELVGDPEDHDSGHELDHGFPREATAIA